MSIALPIAKEQNFDIDLSNLLTEEITSKYYPTFELAYWY